LILLCRNLRFHRQKIEVLIVDEIGGYDIFRDDFIIPEVMNRSPLHPLKWPESARKEAHIPPKKTKKNQD
jgi:hypothetical protein